MDSRLSVTTSKDFQELCQACRKGDTELVDKYISQGVNLNQVDEWDYSPLILASVCGHEKVVRLLLEKGAIVSRDTFEGSRAIYGALTDSIRRVLLSFDISKAVDLTQPFAAHITSLLLKPKLISTDLVVSIDTDDSESLKLHSFMLVAMSKYFSQILRQNWPSDSTIVESSKFERLSWEFLVRYVYLVPTFDLQDVNVDDLISLAYHVGLPDLATSVQEMSQTDLPTEKSKLKNRIQHSMCEVARSKLKTFVQERILGRELTIDLKDNDCDVNVDGDDYEQFLKPSDEQKLNLVKDSYADIIIAIELESSVTYFPVHRAVLMRSDYYERMFNSSFSDTSIFSELFIEHLGIIDRTQLIDSPDNIPIVSLPTMDVIGDLSSASLVQLMEILIGFLYFDDATIPPEVAIPVLTLADSLFIDRLKTMAAVSLTSIEVLDSSIGVSVYDILRAGWETRVHRLETHAAYLISKSVSKYVDDPEFKEIVLESSNRIQARQEFDSIEFIDDIRFYLTKKYTIDVESDAMYDPSMTSRVVEPIGYAERVKQYEHDLDLIDGVLKELRLNA